jgi:hypothetical protein
VIRVCVLTFVVFLGVLTLTAQTPSSAPAASRTLPTNYQVIEFRRYTVREGQRETFTKYFEAYFPEAFQQLGAIAFGDFSEPEHPEHFTWIRGFHDMDDRAKINSAFYYGPVWKEHKARLNDLMTDSDNVLLLRPLTPDSQIPVLPAVDPVTEPEGAKGIVVAQIFHVKPGQVDAFATSAAKTFEQFKSAGARQAGVLVTLDERNNFPQLPVRTDGPYLVWLGLFKDEVAAAKFRQVVDGGKSYDSVRLQDAPELVILRPNPRSRLRWTPIQ